MGVLEKIEDIESELNPTRLNIQSWRRLEEMARSEYNCPLMNHTDRRSAEKVSSLDLSEKTLTTFFLLPSVKVSSHASDCVTSWHPATEYHLGNLKAKLAKYRAQLLEPEKKSAKGEGFDVLKSGGMW